LRKEIIAIAVLTCLALTSIQTVFADGIVSEQNMTADSTDNPPLSTYAVTVTIHPNSVSIPNPGDQWAHVTVTISLTNKGASAFRIVGCKLKMKWSDGHISTMGPSCPAWYKKYTLKPGQTYSHSTTVDLSGTFPLGKSTWTFIFVGIVSGVKMKSQKGILIVTIT
jgi:hypothetical protein